MFHTERASPVRSVTTLQASPDGRLVATGTATGSVTIYDTAAA